MGGGGGQKLMFRASIGPGDREAIQAGPLALSDGDVKKSTLELPFMLRMSSNPGGIATRRWLPIRELEGRPITEETRLDFIFSRMGGKHDDPPPI